MEQNNRQSIELQASLQHAAKYHAPTKHAVEEDFDLEKYPVREWSIQLPFLSQPISFNPLVSLIGVVFLWGVAIWCMVDPEGSAAEITAWRSEITLNFTWLFIGTRCVFFFFLLYVAYRFGHIKLAPTPDEEPEFSTGSYFMMIFAAGVAVALFVYGVAEPLWHQNSHYFAQQGYRTQDEIDQFAINMTVTNWGFTAWAPYLVVAIAQGLAAHRYGLPMTFRSCFYPILGEWTWGWMGDVVDGFTIVTTVAGVCTSLGLGAINIVAGFQFLGWVDQDISQERLTLIQNLTIWGITALATASVLSGLHHGVQLLSKVAFAFGSLLFFLIFVMDNTKFLLNLQVQEMGYYLQWSLFQLNFWTDAFGQLREGEGRAIDGEASEAWWMDAWMVFYQAWWVAWAAFVGLFIARISRGRTVREVILYSLIVPVVYCILWFSVWGGVAVRQSRQAMELEALGTKLYNDSLHFAVPGSNFCYEVPQETLYDPNDAETAVFTNHLPGVTPVCQFDDSNAEASAYNVLYSFSYPEYFGGDGLGPTMSVIFIIALAIYFATSSDSGSLIVDHLASNGRTRHHWIQRLFWAVTEGAVATALLSAGGSNALVAVQAGSVIAGLPYVILLCYLCQSIWVFCEAGDEVHTGEYKISNSQPEFVFPLYGGVFNVVEYLVSLGSVHEKRIQHQMHLPSATQTKEFFQGLLLPFVSLCQILSSTYPNNRLSNLACTLGYGVLYLTWVGLFIGVLGGNKGLLGWAWSFFFAAGILLGALRYGFRSRYNLRSNPFGDFAASLFLWPQVLAQMSIQSRLLAIHQENAKERTKEEENTEEPLLVMPSDGEISEEIHEEVEA